MAQASLAHSVPSRPPLEVAVDRVWRFLCSVRAAIWEIAFLAVLVLVGTLRGSSVPRWIADHVPFTEDLVVRWYAWDVFVSLPFMGILTLLAVAIAICTANRAPGIWTSISRPTVATTQGFLRNAESSARLTSERPRQELAADLTRVMRAERYRVLIEERNGETHLYADRFRWGKLGTFPFHLALILVLVGGVVGARWGFRETDFIVPEGVTRELGHETGVSIRVDDFSEVYDELGVAKEYRSDLTILREEDVVSTGSITVNNPLTFGDTTIYQSGFGQAVRLHVADQGGALILDESLPLGPYTAKTNPDAPAAVLDIPPAGVQLTVIAPDANPANQPELDQLRLRSGQMYLQVRPVNGSSPLAGVEESVIRQGETVALGDLAVTFVREKRFTVLQVARNPGIPIFIAASLLLVGGLAVSFYFPHRRIRGIVAAAPDGTVATLAPMARRDWSAQKVFGQVIDQIGQALPVAVERTDREAAERAEPGRTSAQTAVGLEPIA